MKSIKKLFLGVLALVFLFTTQGFSQDQEAAVFEPMFLVVTTMHRSSDPDIDFSDWMKTEKEYHEKVTMKNDLIAGSGVYFHYFSPDDSEVKMVTMYKTWDAIEKANDVTNKLIDEGWSDEESRAAFFKKQSSYYENKHSDEIYATTPYMIPVKEATDKPLLFYVKVNQRGEGGKGFKEYFDNVTSKNKVLKGYWTHVHRYGADSEEMVEVFAFENLGDIEKSFDEDNRLIKEHWADDDKADAFFDSYSKIFGGHGDYIYTNVPELVK